MKGSGYIAKDKDGHTITSIDGYRAYCIIVDRYSRYTWTFLTKTKVPPLDIITTFLKQQGKPDLPCKTIRTDKGGELWYSQAFRQVFLQAGYILEPTAAGAPSQNGLAERPNLTLSTMVRCLLHSAALGPEYWSFAVLHAVYLKNRLPHSAMGATPYLLYTGSRPSAKELRIFGSHIISKQPGKRPTKLDSHESPKSPSQLPSALPDMPFDIYLSLDPFDNILQIEIPVKGGHPTLGLHLTECPYRHRLRLLDMTAGTPGSRIPKWRSALRNTYLLTIQDTNIGNLEECLQAIQHARKFGIIKLKCTFAVDKSYGIHPHEGIPQLYFDQLNTIAQHLQAIKPTVRQCQAPRHTNPAPQEPTAQSFTLKQLKLRDDWPEWQQSRYEVFDQYQAQGMFSDPMPLPLDSNALRMLWTFQLKLDGTKKSRMVCHMSSRIRNTITLGHTYANSLESTSERLFWAIVAQEDLVVVGTDVSNAFAEAPPPQAPL